MNTRKCVICGKDFIPRGNAQKYCDDCANVQKICPQCGKEFLVSRSQHNRGRGIYCSRECQFEAAKTGKWMVCPVCGKRFYAPKNKFGKYDTLYCSRECAAEGQKTGEVKTCLVCGKKFYRPKCILDRRSANYCSPECALRAGQFTTWIEAETAKALDELGIDYVREWQPEGYSKIYDFRVGNVTIEVNGDYWHNLDGASERDEEKERWAIANGYNPVTIWEHEIAEVGAKQLLIDRVLPLLAEVNEFV